MVLPALRADLQMIETYQCAEEPPLEVPMLVLGGTEDPAVSAGHLMEWRRYTTQDCSVRLLPGGHFFLFTGDPSDSRALVDRNLKNRRPRCGSILERLQKCAAANPMNDGVSERTACNLIGQLQRARLTSPTTRPMLGGATGCRRRRTPGIVVHTLRRRTPTGR